MSGPDWRGKVALVTGAGSGIGAALASALAAEGAKVALTDIDAAAAERGAANLTAQGAAVLPLQLDVAKPAAWADAVAETERALGPINILCSNAGVTSACAPIIDMSADYFRWLLDINLMGAFHAIQATVPGMQARGEGWVLVTASMASLSALPMFSDYCASKHAVLALADSLRQEVAGSGVHVTVLCPASVATSLGQTTRSALPAHLAAQPINEAIVAATKAKSIASSGATISADETATLALGALKRGQFYAVTHPGADQRASARANEIAAAFDALRAGGGHG